MNTPILSPQNQKLTNIFGFYELDLIIEKDLHNTLLLLTGIRRLGINQLMPELTRAY